MKWEIESTWNGSVKAASALWKTKIALALLALGLATPASAISIRYTVEDLPDIISGQDLQQYTFQLSGFDFHRNEGFTILFDSGHFESLDPHPVAPNGDWNVLTGNPIPALSVPGIYDALSIVAVNDVASLANPFTVSFVWLGPGSPGALPFELNQFDEDGTLLQTLGSGVSVSAVADPAGSFLLLAISLSILATVKILARSSASAGRATVHAFVDYLSTNQGRAGVPTPTAAG